MDRVWEVLIDVGHVAPCLPGAAVTGRNDAPESDTDAPTNSSEPTAAAPPPRPPPPGDALRPPQPAEPVRGVPLVSSVLWDRVRRNPAPVAFVLGLLLATLLARRARR